MNEKDIKKAGFEFDKEYEYDKWYTRIYKKGIIIVEFTYLEQNNKLVSFNMYIDKSIPKTFSFREMMMLDLILNKE
ncbi:hypothetical protein [Tenacibaculum caenipelagi]|uniref:Uncharacterized protein n=1 Tax=Tenacibaculum caenipelagi TaxID=1325435 RepID=A0A4R6TIH3_9FLAO|nr:hypothetical protein [Tenacibaculum caenipelagi]TDQ27651.1 hypothetical protein DFQ07_1502 [Tenacibaculum caenipelagi]